MTEVIVKNTTLLCPCCYNKITAIENFCDKDDSKDMLKKKCDKCGYIIEWKLQ